jgi:hypothetical protein
LKKSKTSHLDQNGHIEGAKPLAKKQKTNKNEKK